LSDEPLTLEALADEFGVSRERIRQIEVRSRGRGAMSVAPSWAAPCDAAGPGDGSGGPPSGRRGLTTGQTRRGALQFWAWAIVI